MLTMSWSPRRLRENLRIVRSGPESESGRDDRVDARPVRQARVDHRRRLVDAAPDLGDHAVDDAAQVRVVAEAHGRLVEAALTLDPDLTRAVDHDLRDRVVGQEPLERPVAEDVVGDLVREPLAVVAGDARLAREVPADVRDDAVAHPDGIDHLAGQLWAELADDEHVDRVLEVGERLLLRSVATAGLVVTIRSWSSMRYFLLKRNRDRD